MKKVFTMAMIVLSGAALAQKPKTGPPAQAEAPKPAAAEAPVPPANPFIEHFFKKYQLALRWNDQVSAKDALYDLLAETGSDSLAYTLAVYYYENRIYASTVLIAKDLLARDPKNTNLLQLSASGFEGLGLQDKALINYETLYLTTNNISVLYKMATLQFDIKRYPECQINVDFLLTKKDEVAKLKVSVNEADNKIKEYPLMAALLNLKGLLAERTGNKELAKKSYQEALGVAPDFSLAKENLAKLK
jgi:tetratricopeptide (TPR) repeat protein